MIDIPVLITGLVSVLTLTLSRCRCIVRSNPEGALEYGFGFTDAQLFPSRPPEPAPARPLSTPDPSHV